MFSNLPSNGDAQKEIDPTAQVSSIIGQQVVEALGPIIFASSATGAEMMFAGSLGLPEEPQKSAGLVFVFAGTPDAPETEAFRKFIDEFQRLHQASRDAARAASGQQ